MHSTAPPTRIQTQVLTLPATGGPQETARIADARRIASLLAEVLGLEREVAAGRTVAAADRQPCELGIRAAAHPVLRSRNGGGFQIGTSVPDTVQGGASGASLISPERFLSRHFRALILRQPGQPFRQDRVGLGRASCTKGGRTLLEHDKPVPWIELPELLQHLKRFVVAPF